VGATTENPSFEVISPLLSRCQVYILRPMEDAQLQRLLDRAIATDSESCCDLLKRWISSMNRIGGGVLKKCCLRADSILHRAGASGGRQRRFPQVSGDGQRPVVHPLGASGGGEDHRPKEST